MSEHPVHDAPARVLRRGELVLPDRTLLADLVLQGPMIAHLAPAGTGDGVSGKGVSGTGVEVFDLEGRRVTPGYIDLHVHGGWGVDFYHDTPEAIAGTADRFAEIGVTTLLLTLHPGPVEELLERLRDAARACTLSPSFAGIHLEGPFLAADRRGALPEVGVLPYDESVWIRIYEAAGGKLRVMTFAPEAIPPAVVRTIRGLGVNLSIGHTSSDAATTRAAIDAGAWRATHLCNAMPPIHHRDPGPIPELLLDPRVRCEVICDGEHLDDRMLELVRRVKGPEGLLAVSDAMPLAGLGPAAGVFCGQDVQSDGRRATLGEGTLAGSVTFLPEALRRTGGSLGLTPSQEVQLGATVPALDLGLPRTGRLGRGCRADLVIWQDDAPAAVLRGGEGSIPESWRV